MLDQLSKQLKLAQEKQQAIVLVRVLATEGSTYRKIGARMLIDEQGQQFDLISGGCLETHLGHHAIQVIQQGQPKVIEYDFGDPDSPAWLLGVGCRGRIKLLLEKLCLENNYGSLTYYIKAKHATSPSWLITDLATGQSQLCTQVPETNNNDVTEYIRPAPRLLLIGAGPDTPPLFNLAQQLGFLVQVIDQRSQILQRYNFTQNVSAIEVSSNNLDAFINQNPQDFALVKTHNQQLDADYLSQASLAELSYVGLLGPKERAQRVVDQMLAPAPKNLVAPAGLDLGGDGAHAIALSIVAQIQAQYENMSAQSLAIKAQGIHD